MASDLRKLVEFARGYAAAWCSQDAALVAGFYAPYGSLCINGGVLAVGRKAITEAAQEFMTAFPDMQVLLDDLVIQSEGAVFHWTLIGTNTGPGGKGHRVRLSGFEVWKIGQDGLIAESQGNFDAAEYQRQIEHGWKSTRQ
jgi:predicted ester cyclase